MGEDIYWEQENKNIRQSHNILNKFKDVIIEQRFGYQSGLDESSRHKSTVCLHEIALLVYLVFEK